MVSFIVDKLDIFLRIDLKFISSILLRDTGSKGVSISFNKFSPSSFGATCGYSGKLTAEILTFKMDLGL
jgi:hypothetical protein